MTCQVPEEPSPLTPTYGPGLKVCYKKETLGSVVIVPFIQTVAGCAETTQSSL